jgi:Fur family transcriptional regulator, ferric uptake regulator
MEHRLDQQSAAKAAEEARNDLRSLGLRVTRQRLVLLQILERSDEHLNAQALHARARKYAPNVSLATVYRNLKVFKNAGLVKQSWPDSSDTKTSYESTNKEPHCHFRCLRCQQVVEMPMTFLDGVQRELAGQLGAALTSANLVGYCADCKQEFEKLGRDNAEQGYVDDER